MLLCVGCSLAANKSVSLNVVVQKQLFPCAMVDRLLMLSSVVSELFNATHKLATLCSFHEWVACLLVIVRIACQQS